MKDILFLKRYVESHPDNRMAWYLLGKEYEATGQTGKANYCFNQAGDVYEAFEHTQIPAKWLLEAAEKERQLIEKQRKRITRRRWTLIALMLLLICGISGAPGADPTDLQLALEVNQPQKPSEQPMIYIVGEKDGADGAWQQSIASHMIQGNPGQQAVVLELEQRGSWLLWSHQPQLLGELKQQEKSVTSSSERTYDVQVFDPAVCDCTPDIPRATRSYIAKWAVQMEEIQSLRSGVIGYQKQNGKQPAQMTDLTDSYPRNVMAGQTPNMRNLFEPLRKSQVIRGQGKLRTETVKEKQAIDRENPTLTVNMSPASADMIFQEPYKIVIDKQNHRLAVVSGRVIWRSYEVGLGGDQTPEGNFEISEKVKNPNGKSNGEFGSRGMTLSDTLYAIHGTNEPSSIGKDESHGCIRMRQADVEELFDLVPLGTKVIIKKGILPDDLVKAQQPFKVRPQQGQNQTNPHKVYKWLD
ncbi:L,D-transpeptidase [Paenibacillus guangzhouensis]|uniref:L,D-transpeptidase n=1 Tax=Paenibacillus guangzhouensis TaxID=1473112 RepID=UPI0012672834|nr:L,D-transpeptidase [Paenibacillus guangzhouensis]